MIKIIVPFTPGGTSDLLAREVAHNLTNDWGQSVVVENRPGAGGAIGTAEVARSTPDGYTLLMGSSAALAIGPYLTKEMPYDPARDFKPISLVAQIQNLLVVNPTVPVKTVSELLAYAKSHRMIVGNYGIGSSPHMSAEMFEKMGGIEMTNVPFRGAPEAMTEILAGRLNLIFDNLPSALPMAKSGKLVAIAVSGSHRSALVPDVPTVAESGLPGFDVTTWYGLVAPASVPDDIVNKLSAEVATILARPDVRERLTTAGTEPQSMTPQEFATFIGGEQAKWRKLIADAGLTLN
ncbi:MAG TPA: tripartite tricarboxylate transporter substrate binding protein [Steroidobacteraceae bacterium]|jgi:tripartite-type tricarboxylate transporter receptor subunit TctC|nr:tripartite tricarboxylate transporter substrate binding protein [Steroidobacteraceae bacterium]